VKLQVRTTQSKLADIRLWRSDFLFVSPFSLNKGMDECDVDALANLGKRVLIVQC